MNSKPNKGVKSVPNGSPKPEDKNTNENFSFSTKETGPGVPGLNNAQRIEVDEKVKRQTKTLVDEKFNKLKEEFKKANEDVKKDFVIFFGLFASFVTFLLIEVQIFKSKSNPLEIIGVSMLSLAFISYFALVLNNLVRFEREDEKDWKTKSKVLGSPTHILCYIFVGIGCGLLIIGDAKESDQRKHADYLDKVLAVDHLKHYHDSIKIAELVRECDSVKTKLDSLKTQKKSNSANSKYLR